MKKKKQDQPKVHQDLDGFELKINSLGELTSNYDIDAINTFLNSNVPDKKLKNKIKKK